MDRATRSQLEKTTIQARQLLEQEFRSQLAATYGIEGETLPEKPTGQLDAVGKVTWRRITDAIRHRVEGLGGVKPAIERFVRDCAFTTLNRFAALKLLEARGLVPESVSRGSLSTGYGTFTGLATGLNLLPDEGGYRLYLECLMDELSTEVRVLFDRQDPSSLLWPRTPCLKALMELLNAASLRATDGSVNVWNEDETLGWMYQYFNSDEERSEMRKGGRAPENSYELAVRNQFFTPRYVVRFLLENTLARQWTRMTGGDTRLADLDFLVKPEEGTWTPLEPKDPRQWKLLDPACGSGHFLLYAFDLLLEIYREAWEKNLFPDLRSTWPTLEEFQREAPRLIIENNLHGVDIDPRAAQIAALAIWLRAQRCWKEQNLPASKRPTVRRTHIVVAEPMSGRNDQYQEFAKSMQPPLLGRLFLAMVESMRLAGDMGTLLRVEDALEEPLADGRRSLEEQRKRGSFLPGFEPKQAQGELLMPQQTVEEFLQDAEAKILDALRQYAEEDAEAASTSRRMFAEDAAQGVALIELISKRFDVVVMNPPFGDCSARAKVFFQNSYPTTKNDIYAAFVERGIQLLVDGGLLGAITPRTGFFLPSFLKFRGEVVLKKTKPIVFADLGLGVMDQALVEAAAYCLEKKQER